MLERDPTSAIRRVTLIALLLFLSIPLAACSAATSSNPMPAEPVITPTVAPLFTAVPTPAPQIPESRLLILEWPQTMRVGDSDLILLTLEIDPHGNITPTASFQGHQIQGEKISIPNLFDTHFVLAEGRLDISGFEINPHPQISESLQPGRAVSFVWSIRPEQVGNYRGMVWLHLIFKPKQGEEEERLAVSAQRIEIRVINLFGLSGNAARWMGAMGTFLGSLLSFEPITALFGKLWKHKQKCHPIDKQA
ncbi:MAG: hypothetical protein Kow0088_02180 [Anaerolineales bacterium]